MVSFSSVILTTNCCLCLCHTPLIWLYFLADTEFAVISIAIVSFELTIWFNVIRNRCRPVHRYYIGTKPKTRVKFFRSFHIKSTKIKEAGKPTISDFNGKYIMYIGILEKLVYEISVLYLSWLLWNLIFGEGTVNIIHEIVLFLAQNGMEFSLYRYISHKFALVQSLYAWLWIILYSLMKVG